MGRGPGGRKAAFFVEKQQIKQTYTDPLVLGFRMVWTEVPLSSVGGSFGRPPEPCLEAPFIVLSLTGKKFYLTSQRNGTHNVLHSPWWANLGQTPEPRLRRGFEGHLLR